MNNVNHNFLEDDEVSEAQYVEELVEEIFEEEQQEEAETEILSEAERRIEQANLYQALLKHDLFGPGSARPEIIDAVKKEFKTFILSRLEILLGIRHEVEKQVQIQVQNPFSEEELTALKAIAGRLMKKDSSSQPVAPTVNSVSTPIPPSPKPVVNAIGGTSLSTPAAAVPKKVIKKTVVRRKSAPQDLENDHFTDALKYQIAEPALQKKGKRKQTGNVSATTGQDYSQAAVEDDPVLRPKPMPSQAEMDMLNARQAEMNSRGASPVAGEAGTAGLGAKIAATLLKS